MSKILLVDDDLSLVSILKEVLARDHAVEVITNGPDAQDRLRFYTYDAIVLDWNLPGLSGPEILKEYRDHGGQTPVLMLTAKSEINDKEQGFNSGADDYLTKPFAVREFLARLQALLRRPAQIIYKPIGLGKLTLDAGQRNCSIDGVQIDLTAREFNLLELLLRSPGTHFTFEQLLLKVWPNESDATEQAVRSCIKRLRKKLEDCSCGVTIASSYGVGYCAKEVI